MKIGDYSIFHSHENLNDLSRMSSSPTLSYRPEIDGLRAIAVFSVILFHAGFESFEGGYIGVDVFFVISGYLITSLLLNEVENKTVSLLNFYERRARRLIPALYIVLVACIPFSWFMLIPSQMKDFGQSLIATISFSSNFLFWFESDYFAAAAETKPLLHTWSLAVEEQFYLLFPLVLLISLFFYRKKTIILITILALISFIISEWGWRNDETMNFFFPHSRIWELFVGSIAAFILKYYKPKPSNSLSLLGITMILLSIFLLKKTDPVPSYLTLFPVLGVFLIISFFSPNKLLSLALGNRIMVQFGKMSYSTYLWHYPIFVFAGLSFKSGHFPLQAKLILILVTFFLAFMSWRFIETPARNKDILPRKTFWIIVLLTSFFIAGFGLLSHKSNGTFHRFDVDAEQISIEKKNLDKFVWSKKQELNLKPFEDAELKILIVGDSTSGDFLNAISTSNLAKKASFSSLTIPEKCGNLYLPGKHQLDLHSSRCRNANWLHLQTSHDLMREADWIFLASNWTKKEIKFLDESIENLNAEFGDKFWVVGSKNTTGTFYDYEHYKIYKKTGNLNSFSRSHVIDYNSKLEKEIDRFINPFDWLCDFEKCKFYSDEHGLIQYDGIHLSQKGASSFGKWIEANFGPLIVKPEQP